MYHNIRLSGKESKIFQYFKTISNICESVSSVPCNAGSCLLCIYVHMVGGELMDGYESYSHT